MSEKKEAFWLEVASWVGMLLGAALFLATFKISVVSSGSMKPTLPVGSVTLTLRAENVQRGDMIAFYRGDECYLKRLIGLPGDTISVHDRKAWRNGEPLDEPYLLEAEIWETMEEITVPEGYMFVMGDNRNNSADSRYFGSVPLDSLIGKILIVI